MVDGAKRMIVLQLEAVAPTYEERLVQMALTGAAVAQTEDVGTLQQVFFVTEAWMSEVQQGKIPSNPPSQDPNRKEILTISQLEVYKRKSSLAIVEMIRDQEGKLVELRPMEHLVGEEQVESPLLEAFAYGFKIGSEARRR
jgi:hypothetical protein